MKLSEFNEIIKKLRLADPEIRIGRLNSDVDLEIKRIIKVAGGAEIILSPNEHDRVYGGKR